MQQDVLVQGLGHRATACCTSPCARDGPLCNRPVQHPCARGDPLCNTLVHHTIPVQEAALCAMDLCTTACARGHACAQLLVQEESQCATALHNTRAPPLVQHSYTPPLVQHACAPLLLQEGTLVHSCLCNRLVHHPSCKRSPHVQQPCTPPLVQRPCTTPRVHHPSCKRSPLVQMPCTPPLAQHPVCTTPRARETPRANALHTNTCAMPLHTTPCATPSVHHPSCKRNPTCKCLAHHPSCTTSGRRARSTAVQRRRATPSCNAAPQWLERRWRGGGVCRKSQPNSLRIH